YISDARLVHYEPEIRAYIAQGAKDLSSIMLRPSSAELLQRTMTSPVACTSVVTGIVWFLMSSAVERDQGFVEGSFICRDPHKRLASYFQLIGVSRISSHLKRHSGPGCTGGIDLVACSEVPPLPYGHRHILFIAIEGNRFRESCLFLKPERHGVASLSDKFFHVASWTRSMVNRCLGLESSRVDGPMRKERIPTQLVQRFGELVSYDTEGPKVLAEVGCHNAGEGIACMHAYLSQRVKDLDFDKDHALSPFCAFLELLESTYDFVAVRFGNEVFIDLMADVSIASTKVSV
ncbi:hypothetical protein BD289DRAFT_370822, partial [Coniella lustricola]